MVKDIYSRFKIVMNAVHDKDRLSPDKSIKWLILYIYGRTRPFNITQGRSIRMDCMTEETMINYFVKLKLALWPNE